MAGPEVAEDTPRRKQPRGQATRQKLLAVARDLFAREGYEGTSIGDVAKGAGVGVGTVYHHFADKRTLLIELLYAQAAKARIDLVDDDGGPILRAFRSGDFRASFLESLREIRSLRLDNPQTMLVSIDMGRRDPEVASLCGQMERRFLDIVRRDLEAAVAMGRARGDLDPDTATTVVYSAYEGVMGSVLDLSPDAAEPMLVELTEMIARYLLAD